MTPIIIVDNKDYTLSIDSELEMSDTTNLLTFDWTYTLKTTRATKFQAKKLLKRKLISILLRGVEKANAEL